MFTPIFVISFGVALTMVVFGINQLMHPEKWLGYIPEWFAKMSPMKPETTMRMHAVGNIVFGLLLVSTWHPLVAVWIAFIWWITILPFAFRYNWTIGMRDLSITFSLLALIIVLSA